MKATDNNIPWYDDYNTYVMDSYTLHKLKRLSKELHQGSDRERDFGYRLMMAITDIHILKEESA